jgi:four helix bundle protein
MLKNYKDLIVWNKSMELVTEVYRLVKLLPKEETYALSDQMRRAAVSIPSNIAEGHSRNYDKELIQFLYIAKGSKAELDTQIQIAINLGYITTEDAARVTQLSNDTGMLLNAFISKISK